MKNIWKWLIRPFCDHDYQSYKVIYGPEWHLTKYKCKKCNHLWNELETY